MTPLKVSFYGQENDSIKEESKRLFSIYSKYSTSVGKSVCQQTVDSSVRSKRLIILLQHVR